MDDIKEVMECSRGRNFPEGSELGEGAMCRYIKGGKLYTCSALVCISGRNPQSEKQYDNEWRCTDSWIPVLLTEYARTNRKQTAAVEKFRNRAEEGLRALTENVGVGNQILHMAANRQLRNGKTDQ